MSCLFLLQPLFESNRNFGIRMCWLEMLWNQTQFMYFLHGLLTLSCLLNRNQLWSAKCACSGTDLATTSWYTRCLPVRLLSTTGDGSISDKRQGTRMPHLMWCTAIVRHGCSIQYLLVCARCGCALACTVNHDWSVSWDKMDPCSVLQGHWGFPGIGSRSPILTLEQGHTCSFGTHCTI